MIKSDKLGLNAVIKPSSIGIEPTLQESKVKQVTNEDGAVEAIPDLENVQEDTRSLIQKYWMYMVPVLIMFLMKGQEESGEGSGDARAAPAASE